MPNSASSQHAARTSTNGPRPADSLADRADALCRAAAECCRQHARYARLVAHGAFDIEQRTACKIAKLCDELLEEMVRGYERTAARGPGEASADWWRRANMLLHASREFLRHQRRCDRALRDLGAGSISEFDALTVEYELEASSLVAIQQAVEGYRAARPDADLKGNNAGSPAA